MDTPTAGRKQLTHDRILDTAATALRGAGFAGIGVADIMKRAGLTHGGFYAHFPSREALLAEALERAGEDSGRRMRAAVDAGERKGQSRLQALVENYLSQRHLRSPESGCPVAALACEMPRQSGAVQQAGADRVAGLLADVADAMPPGHAEGAEAVVAAQLVGALQLARALGDNAAGRRHLAAARRFLLDQFDSAPAVPR